MNLFVMLLALLVVGGHCGSALAKARMQLHMDAGESSMAHAGHAEGAHESMTIDNVADEHQQCWDMDCDVGFTALKSSQTKSPSSFDLDQGEVLVDHSLRLPFTRAGPIHAAAHPLPPPLAVRELYYRLCTLRL